jgi:hypothetical protein
LLQVRGTGTTSSTTSFLVQNSAGVEALRIYDTPQVFIKSDWAGSGSIRYPLQVSYGNNANAIQVEEATVQNLNLGNASSNVYSVGVFNASLTGTAKALGLTTNNFRVQGNGQTSFRDDGVNAFVGSSTLLELTATGRGFLLPRTNLTSNISAPAQGLQTYITASATEGIYYYNSGSYQGWTRVLNNSGSQVISGSLELTSALTASNAIISGNVTVLGTASINTLIVNQTQLSTGSNQLGDAANDTQTLYGTVVIPTGSLIVTGSITQTVSTASFGGKVGIGTTTPAYTLDTQGYGRFTSGVVVNAGQRISLGGSDYGSDALYSVGGAPLDVKAYYYTRFTRFNSGQGIQVIQVDGQALIKGSGTTSSTTALLVQNANATPSLAVLDNGYVGIGTSSPSTQLEVFSGSAGGTIKVSNGTYSSYWTQGSSYNTTLAFSTQGNITWGNGAIFRFYNTGDTTDYRLNNGTFTTTNPSMSFSAGHKGFFSFVTVGSTTTYNAITSAFTDNSNSGLILNYKSASVDTEGMRLTSAGLVGIGTTAPSAKLDVSGSSNFTGNVLITGSVNIDGGLFDTVSTGSIPTGSTLIYTINTGSYQAGFFDYYVSSGSNFRAGNIMSVWGAGTYKFTDLATPDIGSTSNLQFSMSLSASSAQLFASASSAGWTVKTTFRTI